MAVRSLRRVGLIMLMGGSAAVAAQSSVRVANEGVIRDKWMLADGVTLSAPGYPASFATSGDNVCVAMGYRINPDGTTGEFTMLRGWNSRAGGKEPEPGFWDAFSRVSAGALAQWRFKPRPEAGVPRAVDTVATMTFVGKHAQDPVALRAQCKVKDLAAALNEAKVKIARRGDMNLHTMDKNYTETTRNEAKRNITKSAMIVD